MENSLYKELSYRVKGFRALSIIVAAVTVILCCIVGIGCWVLIAGVQENEKLLNNAQGMVEKIELTVVEGVQREPLYQMDASNNKAGRVVQHIAEIDFAEGSPVSTEKDDLMTIAQMQNSALHPAPTSAEEIKEEKHAVDPNTYKTSFSQRYEVRPNQHEEIVVQEIDFNIPQNSPNEFSSRVGEPHYGLSQPIVEVPQGFHHRQARPEGRKLAFVDSLMSFTNDLVEDIKTKMNGTIPAVREAFDTLDVLNLFAPIFSLKEPATHRSERSINSALEGGAQFLTSGGGLGGLGSALEGGAQLLTSASYIALIKFVYNEVTLIADHNLQTRHARKLPGDAHTQLLDALYWSPTAKPTTTTEELAQQILTNQAYADGWEPSVNKVSLEFIGEILNTLLNMMREFLMRDHVMECLWFMFCQDLNHQAKYTDAYGYMARINSVGLKVLTVREERDGEMDTIGEIWRALTGWETMQCDTMFPKYGYTRYLLPEGSGNFFMIAIRC